MVDWLETVDNRRDLNIRLLGLLRIQNGKLKHGDTTPIILCECHNKICPLAIVRSGTNYKSATNNCALEQ